MCYMLKTETWQHRGYFQFSLKISFTLNSQELQVTDKIDILTSSLPFCLELKTPWIFRNRARPRRYFKTDSQDASLILKQKLASRFLIKSEWWILISCNIINQSGVSISEFSFSSASMNIQYIARYWRMFSKVSWKASSTSRTKWSGKQSCKNKIHIN